MVGEKTQSFGQIVFPHGGLDVGEGLEVRFCLATAPLHEEADDQSAHHAQDPQSIGVEHPATVVVERYIQTLVSAVFDPPALTVGLEPAQWREVVGGLVGDETDRFVLASDALAGQESRLGGEGKADIFGGDGAGLNGPTLRSALVLFHRAGSGGRRGQRGKNP